MADKQRIKAVVWSQQNLLFANLNIIAFGEVCRINFTG